jgi:hypothetical protein
MKDKLDIIFSKYIRLRDTDEYGHGACFTCGLSYHYDYLQCGHFRKRRNLATRWYQDNAHAQCQECNQEDDMAAYMIAMLNQEGGMEKASEIIEMSKVSPKFMAEDYEKMYKHYRKLVKLLLKDKMFTINY